MAFTCKFGAEVSDERMCSYFVKFNDGLTPVDRRIADRLTPGSKAETRSIALVIGISLYPNLSGDMKNLTPAATDVKNLERFLVQEQKFDEVIVLENDGATVANIEYFLQTYVPQRGIDYNFKSRFLLAYSGHGLKETATRVPAFLLAGARSPDDPSQQYNMEYLRSRLQQISKNYFHVLALINACYGGNVFGGGGMSGGNASISEQPGSHALTAGSKEEPVASLGRSADGSVFFDALIKGISTGNADLDYARLIDVDGTLLQQGGITRLGALSTYLDTEIEIINRQKIKYQGGFLKLDKPWIGPIEPQDKIARGGFFFLSPIRVLKSSNNLSVALNVPAGPLSSLPGRPEIKVFGAQEEYPIRGIDVSVHEGAIDWEAVKRKNDLRFVYVRVSSWAGADQAFPKHWPEVKRVGLDRGGYHVFDYCRNPKEQLSSIAALLPKDQANLPFALSVEIPAPNFNVKQYKCFTQNGIEAARKGILTLAEGLNSLYGKVPLIYGNRNSLKQVVDERFDPYMIWLAVYRNSKATGGKNLNLVGRNPWTLWQYSSGMNIVGIGDNVDANVFFGSEEKYSIFKEGRVNTALQASRVVGR